MKHLYVVRHAKSSWENTSLSDEDRPLNERGKRDAPRMGKRLKEREVHPDLMLTSPAKRALSTCRKIAEVLECEESQVVIEPRLYHAGEDTILEILKKTKDQFEIVMIFGHNPGFTEFVNSLSEDGEVTDNVPTCGIVAFELPISSWSEIAFQKGKVILYDYPKKRKD